jgi:hypothetical protein
VFSERQQVFEQERASYKAGLEQRQALCQRVEALAAIDADALGEAEHELNRIRGEWSRGARLPKREGEAIETRFNDAVRRFNKHKRVLVEKSRRSALESMRARAALCHEAECGAASAETITALQARWQSLGEAPDAPEGTALAARFQRALTAAAGGATDAEAAAGSQAMRESICLRLEILAGVDSPPEHNAARMALQVERLASALKSRNRADSDTAEALLFAWCATGPAPREHAPGLESRFERAWKAVGQAGTASKG